MKDALSAISEEGPNVWAQKPKAAELKEQIVNKEIWIARSVEMSNQAPVVLDFSNRQKHTYHLRSLNIKSGEKWFVPLWRYSIFG